MTILSYKGYQASVAFEHGRIVIHVLHVDDHLVAECTDSTKVEAEFHALIEQYLEDCKAVGKAPDKPYKGVFNVRVPPDLHRSAAKRATSMGITLNDYVVRALKAYEPAVAESAWAKFYYGAPRQSSGRRVRIVSTGTRDDELAAMQSIEAWQYYVRH